MFATPSCSRITPERGCFRPRAHRRAMTAAEAAVLPYYKSAAPESADPSRSRGTAGCSSVQPGRDLAMLILTPREGPAAAPRFRTIQVCPKLVRITSISKMEPSDLARLYGSRLTFCVMMLISDHHRQRPRARRRWQRDRSCSRLKIREPMSCHCYSNHHRYSNHRRRRALSAVPRLS
jgi:hypothetical protein